MRTSCNGCRVLRKGCGDDCAIRPCLEWITSPEAQASATVFLAKFYGRSGLLNLLTAAPDHLRPRVFRSLLHEACGRVVDPVNGSVGLMWSGQWNRCQAAVDAVLRGLPIPPLPNRRSAASDVHPPPHPSTASPNLYDIRHMSSSGSGSGSASNETAPNRSNPSPSLDLTLGLSWNGRR